MQLILTITNRQLRVATKMAQSTMSLLHLDDVMIKFGLSGGLDSRIILAAVLQKPELLENIAITTNTHQSRKGDFEVVERLLRILTSSSMMMKK